VVRELNWLGMLKVRAAWHCNAKVFLGASNQNLNKLRDLVSNDYGLVKKVGADQSCDLIVAAAAGANLATEFYSRDFDESTFKSGVHIFIGWLCLEAALFNAVKKLNQAAINFFELGNGQVASRLQRLNVCTSSGYVVSG
jgi:hypothetical protein